MSSRPTDGGSIEPTNNGGPSAHAHSPQNDGHSRREFVRRAAIASGTVVTLGAAGNRVVPQYSPVGRVSAACVPCVVAGAIGISYVAGVAHERYTAGESDYTGAADFEDHLNLYNRAREEQEITNDLFLAGIRRDASGLKSKAEEQAIIDVYHTVAEGGDREEAEDAAQDAIDSVFAAPEIDLATRWNSIYIRIGVDATDLRSDNDAGNDVFHTRSADDHSYTGERTFSSTHEETVQFLNGESFEVCGQQGNTYHFDPFLVADSDEPDSSMRAQSVIDEPDPGDYDQDPDDYDLDHVDGDQLWVDTVEWYDVLQDVYDAHGEVSERVETILESHYDGIEAGDLSIQDMLSPQAIDETIDDADTWGEIALYFRNLGLLEAEKPALVSIDASEIDEIESDRVEFDGLLGWSVSSDVQDTYIPIGTEVDPDAYPGEFRMAAEWTDSDGETNVDMISLTSPFTVEEAEGLSDYLHFDSREVATADTDPETAIEIFIEHHESEATANERTREEAEDDGDGITLPDMDGEAGGIIGGIIVLILAIVGIAKSIGG